MPGSSAEGPHEESFASQGNDVASASSSPLTRRSNENSRDEGYVHINPIDLSNRDWYYYFSGTSLLDSLRPDVEALRPLHPFSEFALSTVNNIHPATSRFLVALYIYTDGSYQSDANADTAGWGLCVVGQYAEGRYHYLGWLASAVVIDSTHCKFKGAIRHSNTDG